MKNFAKTSKKHSYLPYNQLPQLLWCNYQTQGISIDNIVLNTQQTSFELCHLSRNVLFQVHHPPWDDILHLTVKISLILYSSSVFHDLDNFEEYQIVIL